MPTPRLAWRRDARRGGYRRTRIRGAGPALVDAAALAAHVVGHRGPRRAGRRAVRVVAVPHADVVAVQHDRLHGARGSPSRRVDRRARVPDRPHAVHGELRRAGEVPRPRRAHGPRHDERDRRRLRDQRHEAGCEPRRQDRRQHRRAAFRQQPARLAHPRRRDHDPRQPARVAHRLEALRTARDDRRRPELPLHDG